MAEGKRGLAGIVSNNPNLEVANKEISFRVLTEYSGESFIGDGNGFYSANPGKVLTDYIGGLYKSGKLKLNRFYKVALKIQVEDAESN